MPTPPASPEPTHDWYANLRRNPHFTFHLKESVHADYPARTRFITDVDERRRILFASEMGWYQRKVASVEKLVASSPLVEVLFDRRVSDDLVTTF